jgi:ferritin-like metal-binding protein YciE
MAINSPADVFLWELSSTYDAEKKGNDFISQISGQVRDNVTSEVMRSLQQQGQVKMRNLEGCFQALGTQPREVPCRTVEGMQQEYQEFINQRPSPQAIEMFSVGCMMKLAHHGLASYKSLVDKAMLMSETQCAQLLQNNLVLMEEAAGALERISHEMSQRVVTTA